MRNDFGTRPGDEFLQAAFSRYAMAGFTGVLNFEALRETARVVEAQAREDDPQGESASQENELLAWIDSLN